LSDNQSNNVMMINDSHDLTNNDRGEHYEDSNSFYAN